MSTLKTKYKHNNGAGIRIDNEPQENEEVLNKEEIYSIFHGRIQDINKRKKPSKTQNQGNFISDAG